MLSKWLSRLANGVFFLLFAFLFLNIILCHSEHRAVILLLTGAVTVLLCRFYPAFFRMANALSNRRIAVISALLLGLFFFGCALTGRLMLTVPKTDWGTVYYSAMEIVEQGKVSTEINAQTACYYFTKGPNSEYFVIYPNNLFLLTLLTGFYKLLSLFGFSLGNGAALYAGVLLNVLFITLSALGGFLLARRLYGNGAALLYLILSCLFAGFYSNSYRFYTDTLSLPFVTFSLYAYSFVDGKKPWKKSFLPLLFTGVTVSLGILMKGSVVILLTAFLIHLLLCNGRNKERTARLQKGPLYALLLLLCFLSVNGLFGLYKKNCPYIDYSREEELTFPVTHWIMMAFGGSGGYSQADFEYTASFPGKAQKQAANVEKIKERLAGFSSPAGFLAFELAKTEGTWGDGKFAQENHLAWKEDKGPIYDWILPDGPFYPIFSVYITVFLFLLYSLFLLSAFFGLFQRQADYGTLLCIILTGVILFFSIWETRSRYLLNMTPVFFLFALSGLERLRLVLGKSAASVLY